MQSLRSNKGGGQGLLAAIALICILVGAYFIFKQTKKDEDVFGNVYYVCTNSSCEKEFTAPSSGIPPIKCPHCQQVTGVTARKFKCSKCGEVFIGYVQKYDPQTQAAILKRKRGQNVPDTEIKSIMVSEPGTEDWVDSSTPDGLMIMSNVACPKGCEGQAEPVFPEEEKK